MKLGIAIPVVDHVPAEAYDSHLALAMRTAKKSAPEDEIYVLCVKNIFPHSRAREGLLELAIEKGLSRLLCVDSDMVVPPDGFHRLNQAMSATGAAIVTGAFYQRGYPFSCTWSVEHEGKLVFAEYAPGSGLKQLKATGLAFTLLDLEWISKNLDRPFFRMHHCGEVTVWEDGDFCNRVIEKGGLILGDTSVQCGHLLFRGSVDYRNVTSLRMQHMQDLEVTC